MHVALVTEAALNRRHGTGAQLLRYLDDMELDYSHVYFLGWAGWRSDSPRSLSLAQPEWLERHHRFRSFARRLGLYWWRRGNLRHSTRASIRAHTAPCEVAWVVVGGERGAEVARRIVDELGAPVLLHVMDLFADSLDTCPHFRALASSAAEIVALTPMLAAEFQRVTGRPCTAIGVGQRLDVPLASPPGIHGWDLLLTGRIYPDSLRLLAEALKQLQPAARPRAICFLGPRYSDIPPELRGQVKDLGFIGDAAAFAGVVAKHHVAYLQAPAILDHFGRYSYPSRATDYLMAGLPVVGYSPPGSAAKVVLGSARPGVRLVSGGPAELAAELAAVTATPEAWLDAHRAARAFAERHLDLVPQQAALRAALERCALSAQPGRKK
jgi:hypothetical protein